VKHRSFVLLVLGSFVAAGCGEREVPPTPVARVDNQTLTLEDITARFDSARGASDAQVHTYIQQWITDELLYGEAVRRGLDQQTAIATQLDDIRRQLIINALLERDIYTPQTAESSAEEINEYYTIHRSEFMLSGDVVLVSFALFTERDLANQFRSAVLRGAAWNTALDAARETALGRVDSTYFTQQTLFPPELWRTAVGIGVGSPSFPVRTDDGYYVLLVWKHARLGQQADLAYVEKEIRSRLAIQRRRVMFNTLLENLRAQHSVELLVSPEQPDTAAQKTVE